VQDSSAQQAYGLLPLCPGQQVLDACAAPGGKTLLIAEQAPVEIWAIDQSAHRLQRLVLEWDRVAHQFPGRRLHTVVADLAQDRWPDGLLPMFDHIVLDAPCSGTGVVRRHPEIPWSRSQASIYKLGAIQARLLKRLWRALRPGGQMLYITCSVLPEEGEAQISRFLDETPDATRLSAPGQILPYYDATETQRSAGDGFFYARLQKCLGGSRRPDDRSSEPLAGSR
jgi:16S rRNA (cytosine967-C5)-methyltransferase